MRSGARLHAVAVFAALLGVYLLTLAPGLTFWDAGEFMAAVHAFGVPHPPGTPLYVLIARAWTSVAPADGFALAMNALSAAATAAAGALTVLVLARIGVAALAAVAGTLCAGTMATVWSSATETEVYALSLLLAVAIVAAGERAGALDEDRWLLLTAYLMGLAAVLHTSALVAGPAAIVLAAQGSDGRARWRAGAMLIGAMALAAGAGSASLVPAIAGVLIVLAACLWPGDRRRRALASAQLIGLIVLAASIASVMLIRAQFDPAINQGDPSTWRGLVDHLSRRQYAMAPFWPRQAPLWLQLGNVFQYAEWQIALGTAPGVRPTALRIAAALAFLALAVVGGRIHWRADRRGFLGIATLLAAGSVGVMLYLNLKAGPTIGHGLLSDSAPHEPRERDYFFSLAFWSWGIWAGVGAVTLSRRWLRTPLPGVALAALPALLNWNAADRSRPPLAALPGAVARASLEPLPPDAVLFTWGDNDSYPLWYLQEVEGVRPDVTTITIPLLGAEWYRREVARRWRLIPPEQAARYERGLIVRIANEARNRGRPVAVSALAPAQIRNALGDGWRLAGPVYIESLLGRGAASPRLDAGAALRRLPAVEAILDSPPPPSVDHAPWRMWRLLSCTRLVARGDRSEAVMDSLASRCNSR